MSQIELAGAAKTTQAAISSWETGARGMSAALPHVNLFASAHNLASLQALGKYLAL